MKTVNILTYVATRNSHVKIIIKYKFSKNYLSFIYLPIKGSFEKINDNTYIIKR